MTKKIYQLQIALLGIKPKIWRRVLVNSDISLVDLHRIIQTSMGWTNSHLHQFGAGRTWYSPEEFEVEDTKDSRKIKLNALLQYENGKIKYIYDFGDHWVHDIILEKIFPFNKNAEIPVCTGGKRNCPPEDCGSVSGYESMIKIIADTKHEEHDEWMEWLGGEFDPEYFNMEEINLMLKEEDYGCIWL